jgi:hypothetical protein
MTASSAIGIGSVTATLVIAGWLHWQAQTRSLTAGFWFEDVTFELPHLQARGYGGPIDAREQAIIRSIAWSEVTAAYAGLQVAFSEYTGAAFRVRVVQQFPPTRRPNYGAAGESRVLAPLGGEGAVNFLMLASQALAHAPPGATRAAVIEAIGRGIGRAAVHEFAHQLLPGVPLHASRDERSYEYGHSNRPAQYYGPMHWDNAAPHLLRKLGPR